MGRVKQVTFPISIQGDGSTSNWTINLVTELFDIGGQFISAVSIVDPTGTYTPAGILNGTIAGIMVLAVGAVIPNGTIAVFYVTCTLPQNN